ncbi:MAG: DNA mismatch repair protein MutS [Calditrichota bacterium]
MNLPQGDRTPMLEQYLAIKKEHPDSILFYRMGDFYEMFYEDAKVASEVLGLRLTSRSHGKNAQRVPLAGFPYHQLDSYLTKMVKSGRRVVIVEQTEDPKKAKGLVKRDVSRIVTTGTNPASIDSDEPGAVRLAAILRRGDVWGYAWIEVASGEFLAGQFDAEEIGVIAAQVDPVELVVPEGDPQVGPARPARGAPPLLSKLEDWVWESSFARRTLLDHFNVTSLKGFGLDSLDVAASAAGALLYYLKGNLRADPAHITNLATARLSGRLFLEATTKRNLELVEALSGVRQATLFAVIDKTVTPAGRRLLFNRLLEPLAERARIEERLEAVEELFKNADLRSSLRGILKRSGDGQRSLARLATRRGSARDLVALGETLTLAPEFRLLLETCQAPLLQSLHSRISPLEELRDLLKRALVDDPPLTVTEGGLVRAEYDAEVDELSTIRQHGRTWLEDFERNERQRVGIHNLKVGYNRVFGYYIEITKSQQDKAPDDYQRRQTLVNAERFTTAPLQEYETKLVGAEERIAVRENEIYLELVEKTLAASFPIQENAKVLAEIDFFSSLAELAQASAYRRPVIKDDDKIILHGSRHPVVERLLPKGEEFIANDLEIGGDGARILILTGPNMAGKSTYLRQTALTVILAQMGSFVPALEAHIGLVDKLFTRIGALDNLAGGESTFLVEMQETAAILHNATSRSLVLFDEVGRGTSTFDGLSLAWAIVEYLHETPRLKPRTLFATHFHEMVDLERHLSGVVNFNVAVKEYGDKVIFLRKIIRGGCDRSFGLHVAQMAGLPVEVVARAREVLRNLEDNDLKPGETAAESPAPNRKRSTGLPMRHIAQLSFFDPIEPKLRERLKSVEVNNLTPLEALTLVAELKALSDEVKTGI